MERSQSKPGDTKAKPRVIAIASGKGGTGKTMVAAIIARILDSSGHTTLIVDADKATQGMTLYLRSHFNNAANGISQLAEMDKGTGHSLPWKEFTLPITDFSRARFLSGGDQKKLIKMSEDSLLSVLSAVFSESRESGTWTVVDCQGGIEKESFAIYNLVDDIILVFEPDPTSYLATLGLYDVLMDEHLAIKVIGFFINKCFINPMDYIGLGTSGLKSKHLSTIPFDFGAMRDFSLSRIPNLDSLVSIHIWKGFREAYPNAVSNSDGRLWNEEEFHEAGLVNPDSLRGGTLISSLILIAFIGFLIEFLVPPASVVRIEFIVILLVFLGLIGSIEPTRRLAGKTLQASVRLLIQFVGSVQTLARPSLLKSLRK